MFVNVFGEVYDKNPNLVEVKLTEEDAAEIKKVLLLMSDHSKFSDEEELYIIAPILQKLDKQPVELLRAEIAFLLKVILAEDIKLILKDSLKD